MGARAVVWVATAAVLGAQLAPWRLPAAGLAAVGAVLAVVAGVRRHRVLALAAVAALAASAGRARLDFVDGPASAAGDVGALALPLATILEGEVADVRHLAGPRAVVLLRALSVDDEGTRRRVDGLVGSRRCGLPKLRAGDASGGDDARGATRLRNPAASTSPAISRGAACGRSARSGSASVSSAPGRPAASRRGSPDGASDWRARSRAPPAPRVLRALVLGDERYDDRGGGPPRAGVVHVLSVSGLHVGLVALASFALARWLLARSERALLALDVRRIAALASLGPVTLYGALAGFEVATLRSVIMTGIGVLAVLLGRRIDVLRTLALAAAAVALAQPGAPREIGFQLSFASVLALVLGVRRWASGPPASWRARLRATLVVSVSALAGTAPLTALHFQQVSPMSLLANPLVVPLFGSLVVVLGLAAACVEPVSGAVARTLFALAGHPLRPGIALVELLARPSWAALDVPAPSGIDLVLLYATLATAVLPGGRTRCDRRRLGWAPTPGGGSAALGSGAQVTFLDVGQGDAPSRSCRRPGPGRRRGGFAGSDFDTGRPSSRPTSQREDRPHRRLSRYAHPITRRPGVLYGAGHQSGERMAGAHWGAWSGLSPRRVCRRSCCIETTRCPPTATWSPCCIRRPAGRFRR